MKFFYFIFRIIDLNDYFFKSECCFKNCVLTQNVDFEDMKMVIIILNQTLVHFYFKHVIETSYSSWNGRGSLFCFVINGIKIYYTALSSLPHFVGDTRI